MSLRSILNSVLHVQYVCAGLLIGICMTVAATVVCVKLEEAPIYFNHDTKNRHFNYDMMTKNPFAPHYHVV